MGERHSGHERFSPSSRSAKRISHALTFAAPDSLVSKLTGRTRSSRPEPILKYPDASGITISADYGVQVHPIPGVQVHPIPGVQRPGYGLKVEGEERVYSSPKEIETLLQRNGLGFTGRDEAQQNEALLLHGILAHGEANRDIPPLYAGWIEQTIANADKDKAQTLAELNGKARVYFPFVPQEGDSHGSKMVQVITSRTKKQLEGDAGKELRDEEVKNARDLVTFASVRQVLESIPDHAVTLERVALDGFEGVEFIKITDTKGKEHMVHELLSEEVTAEMLKGRKLVVVTGAGGANAGHFSVGMEEQKILIAAVGRKKIEEVGTAKDGYRDIYPELQFNTKDPDDDNRLEKLLASGLVSCVYDSTPVDARVANLKRALPYLVSGKVDRFVTTKPVARSIQDLLEMKRLLRKQDNKGKRLEEKYGVHEHYLAKGPLAAFFLHAEEVVAALGVPTKLEISIQEERTAENDGGVNRVKSLPDGLMQDLAPHALSITIMMRQLISNMGYDVPLYGKPIDDIPLLTKLRYSPTEFETYRYTDPVTHEQKEVPIETGFVVEGQTTVAKNEGPDQQEPSEQHDLRFVWRGGKGLANDKQVTITFRHPVTGDESKVVIDLNGNIAKPVDAPDSIQYLFKDLEGKPQDNGYGGITAAALINDHPEKTFQPFHDASVVWVMEQQLKRLSNGTEPYTYLLEGRTLIDELAHQARRVQEGSRQEEPVPALVR